MATRRLIPILVLSAALLATAAPAWAAAGDLDPTFGVGGKVITDITGNQDSGEAVAIQPDGKIVVAGEGNDDFAVVRYLTDGTPDPAFGGGDGIVTTDIDTGSNDFASALVLQPDGKIVVAGGTDSFNFEWAIVRYLSDGTPDPAFGGGDGIVITDVGGGVLGGELINALILQPDGKIVAVGSAFSVGNSEFGLVRYLTDGTPDPAFGGGDGIVMTGIPGDVEGSTAQAAVLLPDGKIVAAGRTDAGGTDDFALIQYLTDGTPDPAFGGGDGIVITDISAGSDDFASALVLQPDGKLVAGGSTRSGGPDANFALARYLPGGDLDPAFGGGDGIVTTDLGADDGSSALVLQPDGKLVAAGFSSTGVLTGDFALARYLPNGDLDPDFGTGGIVTTDFGASDFASGLALQSDGGLVAAGALIADDNPALFDIAVARYLGDPPPPPPPPPPPGDDDDDDDPYYDDSESDFDFDTPFSNTDTDTNSDSVGEVAGSNDAVRQDPEAPAAPLAVLGDTGQPEAAGDVAATTMTELPRTGLGTMSANTRAGVTLIALGALATLAGRRRKATQA